MPLAPRPHVGEGISFWIARMAARYDITGDDLGRLIIDGRRSDQWGGVACLDHRADLISQAALASAARIETTRIDGLRIVRGDGSASCWHRDAPSWCLACLQNDLLRDGEVHGRAVWRLGCSVLCPEHDLLLDHRCRRCDADSRCRYRPVDGRLGLICDTCERPVVPNGDIGRRSTGREGAFRIALTPQLFGLVRTLQRDLIAGLAEGARPCAWGPVRSSAQLMAVVSAVTLAAIWSADLRVAPRIDLFAIAKGQAGAGAYEPITLALLTPYAAFGLMALIAIFLEGLGPESCSGHVWQPDGRTQPLTVRSFLTWLTERERRMLHAASASWGREACNAARRAIDAVTQTRRRPGGRSPAPDVRRDQGRSSGRDPELLGAAQQVLDRGGMPPRATAGRPLAHALEL